MSWNLEFKRVMLWHCPFLCGDFFKICLVHAFIFCGANAQKHNEHYNTRGTMLRARDARLSALSLLCSVFKYLCFCALFETRCENTESYNTRETMLRGVTRPLRIVSLVLRSQGRVFSRSFFMANHSLLRSKAHTILLWSG